MSESVNYYKEIYTRYSHPHHVVAAHPLIHHTFWSGRYFSCVIKF